MHSFGSLQNSKTGESAQEIDSKKRIVGEPEWSFDGNDWSFGRSGLSFGWSGWSFGVNGWNSDVSALNFD